MYMCLCVCVYILCRIMIGVYTDYTHTHTHTPSATIKWMEKRVDNNGTQNGMPSVEYMIIIHNGSASSDWAFFTIEIQKQQRSSQPNTEKTLFVGGDKRGWQNVGGWRMVVILSLHWLHTPKCLCGRILCARMEHITEQDDFTTFCQFHFIVICVCVPFG